MAFGHGNACSAGHRGISEFHGPDIDRIDKRPKFYDPAFQPGSALAVVDTDLAVWAEANMNLRARAARGAAE